MTDIAALEAYAGQLSEAIARIIAGASKQHEYIHGDELSDILTESGLVPTLAKQARLAREKSIPEINIKDAPFNGRPGGSDQTAAFTAFFDYLASNGGQGHIPSGYWNAGTFRLKKLMADGAFKSFVVYGDGDSTEIYFKNIDPIYTPGAGQKGLANEPNLFDVRGVSASKIPGSTVTFRDFAVDYSDQRFKGGASEATPALTDIDPLSCGMKLFYCEYGRIIVERVTAKEIYGEFIQCNRSPFSVVKDCDAYNVSAGNIGRNDSTGAFALILRGSATGCDISGNRAVNKRVYQTDTIGGYTDRTAKGTPCGYMGVGVEYGNDVNGLPAVDYELWANAGKPNFEAISGSVKNNTMIGYYMGFKAESDVVCDFSSNKAFNCWMPFVISSRCRGSVRDNYADRGYLDDLIQPMGGLRNVQGMYVYLAYAVDLDHAPGVLMDGNGCIARSIPIFTTNTHHGQFLNQNSFIDGPVDIMLTRADKPLRNVKVSGMVTIRGLPANRINNIADLDGGRVDLTVINRTSNQLIMQYNNVNTLTKTLRVRGSLKTEGLVGVSFLNCTPENFYGDFELTDITKSFADSTASVTNRFFNCDTKVGSDVKIRINTHSKAVTAEYPVICYMGGGSLTLDIELKDAGSNNLGAIARVGGAFNRIAPNIRIAKLSDAYAVPLISYYNRYARSITIDSAEGSGSLFAGSTVQGPVYVKDDFTDRLSPTGTTEPNLLANLRVCSALYGEAVYTQGKIIPYLRPAAGGFQGIECITPGWLASAWAATTAVPINEYRQVNAKVYRATVAGTTSAAAPSHSSGTAVDGTVTWTYIGPQARFAGYGSIGSPL